MGELWQYITPDTKGKGRPKEKDSTAIRAKWCVSVLKARIAPSTKSILLFRFHENQSNNRNKPVDSSKSSKWYACWEAVTRVRIGSTSCSRIVVVYELPDDLLKQL